MKHARTILVSSLLVGFAAAAQEPLQEPDTASPRLATLKRQLQGGDSGALGRFWQEMAQRGTPLVEPLSGDEKHLLVTFLWREKDPVRNVVIISGLKNWNYGRSVLPDIQMARLPGTDVWFKPYRVRSDARFTYKLSVNDSLIPEEDEHEEDAREARWQPDPLNLRRVVYPRDEEHQDSVDEVESVVELPNAPPQPWIVRAPGGPQGTVVLHRFRSTVLGNERRIWVYTPPSYKPGSKPLPLLVLFDGRAYTNNVPVPVILDNLLAAGKIPPAVAVFVDNVLGGRRRDLTCNAAFNRFLAEELLPWIRDHRHISTDPRDVTIGGLSRGGLGATCAALEHPGLFGNVLAQSGAFLPVAVDTPIEHQLREGWLMEQFSSGPRLPLRFYLDVGTFEIGTPLWPSFLLASRHMRDVLRAKGYPLFYQEFVGSHDSINWRGTLPDGLIYLLNREQETKTGGAVPFMTDPIASRVDGIFERWDKPDSPGCAVGVMREGRIIYSRGYGMADVEHAVPITPATVFNAASISKQFTAAAVALLAQRGKLSLDDHVRKYVPELPEFGVPITLRHLIHHTSGLRMFWPGGAMRKEDVLQMVSGLTWLEFQPGAQYRYGSLGYLLLGIVVERVSGRTLREFTRAEMFVPLGMNNTFFLDQPGEIIRGVACSYERSSTGGFHRTFIAHAVPGSGMLHTTVEDLAKWDGNFYAPRLGGREFVELLLQPGRLNDGTLLDYAFGLSVGKHRGLRVVQHGGWHAGYRHHFVRFPEQRLSVAVLCNAGNASTAAAWNLAYRVADLYVGGEAEQAVPASQPVAESRGLPPEQLTDKVGLYWDPQSGAVRRIGSEEGKLYVVDPADGPLGRYEVEAVSAHLFRVTAAPAVEYRFERAEGSERWRLIRQISGRPTHTFERATFLPSPAERDEYAGLYLGDEVDLLYRVLVDNGRLVLSRLGSERFVLEPLSRDLFHAAEWRVQFRRDEAGAVAGLTLTREDVHSFYFARLRPVAKPEPRAAPR